MSNQEILIPSYPGLNGGPNSSPVPNSIIATDDGNTFQVLPSLGDGELLIGSEGGPPIAGNIQGVGGVTITNNPGQIIIGTTPGAGATLQQAFDNGLGTIQISSMKDLIFLDENGIIIDSFLNTGSTHRQNVIYYSSGNIFIDISNIGSVIIPTGSGQTINISDETISGLYPVNSCFDVIADYSGGTTVLTSGSATFMDGSTSFSLNQYQMAKFIRKSMNLWYYELTGNPSTTGNENWITVTSISQNMSINTGYIVNTSTLCTLLLPTIAPTGSYVDINGFGSGLWKISQNSGQIINTINGSTTVGTGGSLSSTGQYDKIRLRCIVTNLSWEIDTVVSNQINFV